MNITHFDSKSFLNKAPNLPGVYQMSDKEGNVLYVGKARNLKKRLASYFTRTVSDSKTKTLLEQIADISLTLTKSDNEALLLENNLIKELKPRYNVLLRDDKSYPFLFLSAHEDFPRLDFHRGPRRLAGSYFGPYSSSGAVRETLTLLQKLFKIRQCSDSFFANRSRPCLQYHIKRCTAPCVGYIDSETYLANVKHAELFLKGKNNLVIDELAKKMEEAADKLEFETAAKIRDQIVSLRRIQERQYITSYEGNTDIIAIASKLGEACIHVLTIRSGRLIGSKSYFPNMPKNEDDDHVLSAFLPQYYLNPIRREAIPNQVLLNITLLDRQWIQNALSESLDKRITFSDRCRGKKLQWIKMANTNAEYTLEGHLSGKASIYRRLEGLQKALNLANIPQRLECFDVSHTTGEATVASCVVFNIEGPLKKDYRRFNIHGIKEGDDYGALRQALSRRYTRIKTGEGELPDILFIDGGKGQLHQAEIVLEELQVSGVMLIAIAKGEGRRPGLETLYISGRDQPLSLSPDSMALHLVQQIRDEAHRFAITFHRQKRGKARSKSVLEQIPGIGAKRRKELLRQFGGLQELKRASVEDIAKVHGINLGLAQKIFDSLHT
jgi:excinuclease ABC subunit C